jgi:NAD(P)-dependent dehydrogenase (short-subunit alcohol dehydrogenase family)
MDTVAASSAEEGSMAGMDSSLQGRVAIVTGASRGIGEAIAREFARRGATVVVASRKLDALEGVAASINAGGAGKAIPVACHTGQPPDIEALFERVRSDLGRLDVLVNNAATNPYFGPALGCSEAAFDKTFAVNVKGYFLMSQHAARMMVAQRSGSIINVASVAGVSPHPMQVVYSMTKAAVISMTRGMAKELGSTGVRVNAIAPGVVETKLAAALIDNPEIHRLVVQLTPLGRHGQPDEIVGAALYLATDASSFTTGSVLVCDGGMTA